MTDLVEESIEELQTKLESINKKIEEIKSKQPPRDLNEILNKWKNDMEDVYDACFIESERDEKIQTVKELCEVFIFFFQNIAQLMKKNFPELVTEPEVKE